MYDLVCVLTGEVVASTDCYSEAVELQYAYREVDNIGLEIVDTSPTPRQLTPEERMTIIL